MQEGRAVGVAHGVGDPGQVVVARGQDVGLLVVQVLDAVLHAAQKDVGACQGVGGLRRHEPGGCQARQCVQRGAAAQFGELPAAHHLQQLHGELDFADAAAREFDVVGALGVARATLGGVFADLAVQAAQRLEHVVVQVAPEHKGQHHAAQGLHGRAANAVAGRHHAALEPGKALPFAALHLQVFLQRRQRNSRRPRVAVGPQRQVHAEHAAVLGGVAHCGVDEPGHAGKVFGVGDASAPVGRAAGLAVVLVYVDQVDVTGHVELARAQLAHADDPELHRLPFGAAGVAVAAVQFRTRLAAGLVERDFGQFGGGLGDGVQRRLGAAVQLDEPCHHQLAQDAQRRGQGLAALLQGGQCLQHAGAHRGAWGQQLPFIGVTALQTLVKARVQGQVEGGGGGGHSGGRQDG